MMNKHQIAIVFVIAISLILVPSVTASQGGQDEQPESACIVSEGQTIVEKDSAFEFYMQYSIQVSEESNKVCVIVENRGNVTASGEFGLLVDNADLSPEVGSLKPGQSKSISRNLTPHLDLLRDNHTVRVNAGGESVSYNFTQNLTPSDIPHPYINGISVGSENKSANLKITLHNPGRRAYGLYVQVETFETDGVFELAAPQPGDTRRITLSLDEQPNETIAGKAMLYSEPSNPAGKFDQKEFLAKPNETVNAWDDNFEQIPGGTVESEYTNETARQYREGYVNDRALSPLERRAGAVLVVVAVLGAVLWRRR